ncbi:hypothetical protein [Prauserella cavernicola]|uniref:Uncharacterized protein n=1 Tax=Prauserella cavernicola TaxID=2800127 RepID=A0A934QU12_9PSEU|nr:hypothetical protein [Prauserella cavernicola]MBK1786591.1 hypothetical protein [Prauserella cavernicola]
MSAIGTPQTSTCPVPGASSAASAVGRIISAHSRISATAVTASPLAAHVVHAATAAHGSLTST